MTEQLLHPTKTRVRYHLKKQKRKKSPYFFFSPTFIAFFPLDTLTLVK